MRGLVSWVHSNHHRSGLFLRSRGRDRNWGQEQHQFGQALLQDHDLGRELWDGLENIDELARKRRRLLWQEGLNRGRCGLWEISQQATMGGRNLAQALGREPFDASIAGMWQQGDMSQVQPTAQRFRINGQQTTTVGQRYHGHQENSLYVNIKSSHLERGPEQGDSCSREL